MENKYASRIEGVKQEKIDVRPDEYSKWHRKLGKEYLAVDIDFVEYRIGRGIVGLFAVTGNLNDEKHLENSKKYIIERTKVERNVLIELCKGKEYCAYLVLHTKDLSCFHVWNLCEFKDANWIVHDEKSYSDFVRSL